MTDAPRNPEIPYEDIFDVPEQFADHLQTISLNGQVATLTFAVTRIEETEPGQPSRKTRYTSARLVIPTDAFLQLYNMLTGMMGSLEAQGIIKRDGQQPGPLTVQ